MSSETPPPPSTPPPPLSPTPIPSTPPREPKKHPWLLYGCGGLLALMLLIIVTVVITIWWIQRPIKPVVLSAREKAVVDQKLQRLDQANPVAPTNKGRTTQPLQPAPKTSPPDSAANSGPEVDDRNLRIYVPGSKELRLTEREVNGLLNSNTDLGRSVRLEFAQDAINAYIAVRIPEDFPIGGGKMFRARGRFRVSIGNGGTPYAILDDLTVFGLSLPKAWLGGLKGENLIGDAMGKGNQSALLKGIKSLRVEPGALVLEVAD